MASLNVRGLPQKIQQRLRVRAARAGRSMEAEARDILARAVSGALGGAGELQAFVERLYGPGKPRGVVDELIRERRREADSE